MNINHSANLVYGFPLTKTKAKLLEEINPEAYDKYTFQIDAYGVTETMFGKTLYTVEQDDKFLCQTLNPVEMEEIEEEYQEKFRQIAESLDIFSKPNWRLVLKVS